MMPTPKPPTRRARVSLFARYLAQILSGVDLTNSKALSVLGFESTCARKLPHTDKYFFLTLISNQKTSLHRFL